MIKLCCPAVSRHEAEMAEERILIVDDDPDVVEFCARILRLAGYQVKGTMSGLEAIEAVRRERFELVLTDIKMPGMDGLEMVRAIRQIDPSIVAVTMTGHGTMEMAVQALRMGTDDFVIKPFALDELKEVIASALAKERLQRENVRLRALIPLYELSKAFMSMTNLQELLQEIVQVSCQETGADRASLMLLSEDDETLTIQAAIGLSEEVIKTTATKLGEGIAGRVALQGEPLVLDSRSPPGEEFEKLMKLDQISSAICIPLTVRNELIGVLNLSKLGDESPPFTTGSVQLTSVLAGQAAIAIKNAYLFEEIQQAYSDLKRLDKLKSEFINVASHELRTPLAILLGYASLLEEQTTDTTRKYVLPIIQNALRLRKLLTDMLNLRYLEAGEMDLELEPVQFSEVVDAVLEDLGFLADEKGEVVMIEIGQDLPSIWADKGKLHLILSNLISNAIKFTPEGGEIAITALAEDDELTVAVRDTGVGIASEEYDRIFDRFYQVEDSLTRRHLGLGLGLSIVKELVELHQGRVWVESQTEEGSTFYFTISRHLVPQPQTD
ncbi:MAG: hypothetical protein CEE40_05990 [Chloroflexi bacterium B3_Chlor]|nr:MAG: hypothetical protein CEE40_05990 [Chloroflexi bacterium B3_Chlor]